MTNLDQAREWANGALSDFPFPSHEGVAARLIQSLPDQWVDVEEVRELLDRWSANPFPSSDEVAVLNDVEALITPKLPTLADMSMSERDERKWAQAYMEQHGRGIITCILDDSVQFMKGNGLLITVWEKDYGRVTPLPDLPKLEWPGSEVVETPVLPEDERITAWGEIAGHKFFNDCYRDGVLLDHMIKKLDEVVDVEIVEESEPVGRPPAEKAALPKPEDVPANEPWLVEADGQKAVGARYAGDSVLPWSFATLDGSFANDCNDSEVKLIHKLVPEPPALPEGMRLANHERYGRVVVSPHPYEDGDYEIFGLSALTSSGSLVTFCKENKLTFLDGGN